VKGILGRRSKTSALLPSKSFPAPPRFSSSSAPRPPTSFLPLFYSVITVVCADSAYNPASYDFGSQTDEPVVSEVTKTYVFMLIAHRERWEHLKDHLNILSAATPTQFEFVDYYIANIMFALLLSRFLYSYRGRAMFTFFLPSLARTRLWI